MVQLSIQSTRHNLRVSLAGLGYLTGAYFVRSMDCGATCLSGENQFQPVIRLSRAAARVIRIGH